MKKSYWILFIFILLIMNNILAVNLKISPVKIEFNASVSEKTCQKIFIATDYREELTGSDRWTKSLLVNKKDINQYNKKPEELGLKLKYDKKLIILDDLKKEVEICFVAEKHGKYNGALIYSAKNSVAGVGIWIFAHISENEEENYFSWMGPKVVGSFSELSYEKVETAFYVFPVILISFLIILIVIKKKQDKKSSK